MEVILLYKHILLASDGSEYAVRAAKEAVKLASFSEESIIEIVYVIVMDKGKYDFLHASSKEETDVERHRKNLNVLKLLDEAGTTYKTTILRGEPGPEIVKYANEQKVDIVVIGSRGLNTLQTMMLGSVSHKVMKRVNCPALIVK